MIKLKNGMTYETADVCFTDGIETLLGFAMDMYLASISGKLDDHYMLTGFVEDFFKSHIGRAAVDKVNAQRQDAMDDMWIIGDFKLKCLSVNTDAFSGFQIVEDLFDYSDLTNQTNYCIDWYDGCFSDYAIEMRLD